MLPELTWRMMRLTTPRLLFKFVWNFGCKSIMAVRKFEARRRHGIIFPAFVMLSVTNRCNLECQGCWVSRTDPPIELDLQSMDWIVSQSKKEGCRFFGLLGGEPLMHPEIFSLIEAHPDCYFQVFTNGTALTPQIAARMRELGNITPLISIEGNEAVSDTRRQGREVWTRSMQGLRLCTDNRLITGVATSICKSNINDLVSHEFLCKLINAGILYVWYYIYRPVGSNPCPELALEKHDILRLRRFMVDARTRYPIILVDAYWDAQGRALCPAATGIGYHVSPAGAIEICPPIQFSTDSLGPGVEVSGKFTDSRLLNRFREKVPPATRGCVLLEQPELLREIVTAAEAGDSSLRQTAMQELAAMRSCCSHHLPGEEIPERHWLYRLAKRYWFFGFGAYG